MLPLFHAIQSFIQFYLSIFISFSQKDLGFLN